MKNSLRFALVALAFVTTGLLAHAATATDAAPAPKHQHAAKGGKKSAKKHKHHGKKKRAK